MDNDKDQLPSSTLDRILVSSVSYVLVLAGFLLITGAVFFYELFEARQYLTTQFQADALRRTETVQGLLNYPLTHMNTIRMFFSSSEEVTSQEFGQFCREWIDQGIFLLIGWIPPANVREAGGGYVLSSELRTSEIGSLPWNDNELDTIMSKENSLTENRILIDSERPGQILALMPVSATKGILYARFDPDSLPLSVLLRNYAYRPFVSDCGRNRIGRAGTLPIQGPERYRRGPGKTVLFQR
ncbi:hypothetical protein [Marispirochaeta aestuarii]|uniref:hypothetical protein n=1 Tax=Marispirochaeta aestuarii TaxID=1963862 RepID=UPI0029C79222|nr:hypothetical protein [Marispirochaeta aestuarii]